MANIRNGASSQIDMSIQQHYTNTLHFRAYKRLVEGVRTSESTSSTWECRALSSSGIPEAARHEDTTTPGSGATLTWDSRSLLMGIGQGGATSSSVRSRDQGWFGQFGAVTITEAPSFLIVHNTSGNILIGGNAYSLAAGQRDVSTATLSGEWDGATNSGQCAFSLVANRSTSAVPCQVQIIRSDPRCNFHSPWGIPLPWKSICSSQRFRRLGTCVALMERKWRLRACTELWIVHSRTRNHRHFVGATQYMQLFQLRP